MRGTTVGVAVGRARTALLATTLALPGIARLDAQQAERFELAGGDVAIYNLVGEVTVEPGGGSAVVVDVQRGGPDGARLTIGRGPARGQETLRVVYPADEILYRGRGRGETTLHVRDDGTFGEGDHWGHRGRREGRRVRIRSHGSGLEAHADLRILVPPGQRLALYVGAGAATVGNVSGRILVDAATAPVRARGVRGELVIDVGSGDVTVTDIEGTVDVDTGSGGVDVSGVRGDRLRVDTGSGAVRASQIAVRDLEIDTGSGRINVTQAAAERVLLDTGSGAISIELATAPQVLEIDTGSGSVTVTVPEDFGAEVAIETGSGGIDVDFPLTLRRWERNRVVGTIGDGTGRLVIDTGSGSIRLRRRTS